MKFKKEMTNLHSILIAAYVFSFITIINHSSSARTLTNPTPTSHHHTHHKFSFLMRNVLNITHPPSISATTKLTGQLPFQKPLGLFPPDRGIPISDTYTMTSPVTVPGLSTQTLDLSRIGLSFPARATLQELEFGIVTPINEDLFEGSEHNVLKLLGKAEGLYVASNEGGSSHMIASNEGGSSHMIAMTVYLANSEFKDGLRFFGIHHTDGREAHIAVIGGVGQYDGANGYATVKVVRSKGIGTKIGDNRLLSFNVYLS